MMGGLAILLIVVLYVALAVWLVVRAKGWRRKFAAGLIAFLLPTADGYIGRKYVEHLCAKDGGLKIFRVVEGVEGVLGLGPDRATLKRTGYRFIEYAGSFSDPKRAYRRLERLQDERYLEAFDTEAISKYEVLATRERFSAAIVQYAVSDDLVRDRQSAEVLARYRHIGGGAGWAERFLGQFTDAGGAGGISCPPYEERPGGERLAMMVLKPAKAK
ncbi:MAG: hypothetical protein ACT4P9_02740 [Betaproteobacteria bacterium]